MRLGGMHISTRACLSIYITAKITQLKCGYSSFMVHWTAWWVLWRDFRHTTILHPRPHNSIKLHYETKS